MVATSRDVEREDRPGPELVRFLESIEYGGSGLRYRRKGVAELLAGLDRTEFLSVSDRDAIVAAYALTTTDAVIDRQPMQAVYRGLLAVAPSHRRQGLGRRLVEAALLRIELLAGGEALLSFGLIEASNEGSRRLVESLGAQDIGGIESRLVYRQWPRASSQLRRLDEVGIDAYRDNLDASPADPRLSIRTAARLPAYALVDGDRIAAAARIGSTTIDLGQGGALARILHRYGYSRFQALGRRYNRRAFRYLTIHDPLVTENPGAWRTFVPALLAEHEAHMALFTLDPRSEARLRLMDAGLFGRFSEATRQELRILANAWNLGDAWASRLAACPLSGGPVY